ncbi:unnamed protein product [Brachionus calyciflorus]|uniref:Uncharacterized protein n=1 Tax=Brachionus calyciflorus TaxID=104777 RepID=A0A814G6Q1_9BILA|nr:unnamed protein product [Brachionus calyciflorus]
MRIFNAAYIPMLHYGCESWTKTETSSDTFNLFVRTFSRIICGVKQSETHMTNEELYRKVKQRPIIEEIRKRQLKLVGHCLRIPPGEPALRIVSRFAKETKFVDHQHNILNKYRSFKQMVIKYS